MKPHLLTSLAAALGLLPMLGILPAQGGALSNAAREGAEDAAKWCLQGTAGATRSAGRTQAARMADLAGRALTRGECRAFCAHPEAFARVMEQPELRALYNRYGEAALEPLMQHPALTREILTNGGEALLPRLGSMSRAELQQTAIRLKRRARAAAGAGGMAAAAAACGAGAAAGSSMAAGVVAPLRGGSKAELYLTGTALALGGAAGIALMLCLSPVKRFCRRLAGKIGRCGKNLFCCLSLGRRKHLSEQ